MIYFPLFANFNAVGRRGDLAHERAPFLQSFASGCAAGSVAAVAVTPLDGETRMIDRSVRYLSLSCSLSITSYVLIRKKVRLKPTNKEIKQDKQVIWSKNRPERVHPLIM